MENQGNEQKLVTVEEIEREVPGFKQVRELKPYEYLSKQYWSVPRKAREVYYKLAQERGLLIDRNPGAYTIVYIALSDVVRAFDDGFSWPFFNSIEAAENFVELFHSQPVGYDETGKPKWGKWLIVQITNTFTCEKFAEE